MNDISIERASLSNVEEIKSCIDQAYAPFKTIIKDLPDVSEGIEQDIRDNYVLVAKYGEKIVGTIIANIAPDRATIANLAVTPQMKGQGLGRTLMKAVEDETRKRAITNLYLSTHEDMPKNVQFYTYLGWEITDHVANKIMMSKTI